MKFIIFIGVSLLEVIIIIFVENLAKYRKNSFMYGCYLALALVLLNGFLFSVLL